MIQIPDDVRQYFALIRGNRIDEAEKLLRTIVARHKDQIDAVHSVGVMAHQDGLHDLAFEMIQRTVASAPFRDQYHHNLGVLLHAIGKIDDAITCYQRAIKLNPKNVAAHNNLGNSMQEQGRLTEAIECYQRALALNPDLPLAYNNMGGVLKEMARHDEAEASLLRAWQADANYLEAHSNWLFTSHYSGKNSLEEIFARHVAFGARVAGSEQTQWPNSREAGRPLKVGFVSGDFRHHPVAYFMEPLLEHFDDRRMSITLYSSMVEQDPVSVRLQKLRITWRDIPGIEDARAAKIIADDKIDILIDLAGHTAANRMSLFARRAAPVQATYLGYPNTTGLRTIDWRITDAVADPEGAEALHTERLWRLPGCFLCYRPPADAPAVAPVPAATRGHITFGSFNRAAKLTGRALRLWAQILARVPDSRLVIKSHGLADGPMRDRVMGMATDAGIDPARLELLRPEVQFTDHLARYDQFDIAVDTTPYCGTTTTCEAMWMGLPVVTLAERAHVTRVGASLLSAVGLSEWIAHNEEQYVQLAVDLASDLPRLIDLRAGMRARMESSGLVDGPAFARKFEAAVAGMWADYVSR